MCGSTARVAWWLGVVLALVLSCSPGGGPDDGRSGGGTDDDAGDDGGGDDDGSGDATPPEKPFVYPPDNPYPLDTIALKGYAEPLSTLDIVGGPEPYQGPVPEDGNWCAIVGLYYAEDHIATNVLLVTATDAAGNVSEPMEIWIFVDPSLTPVHRNGAPEGTPDASSVNGDCEDCGARSAFDDLRETWWSNATSAAEGTGWDRAPQWLRVDLGRNYYVDGSEVIWGAQYATDYRLYYSDAFSPAAPDVSLADWIEYGRIEDGNGLRETFLAGGALARWFAIVMEGGNAQNPETGKYRYQIKEFTVVGVPWDEAYPDPSCP